MFPAALGSPERSSGKRLMSDPTSADSTPASAASPVVRGRTLLREGQLDAAAQAFAEAIAANPVSAEANEGAATVAYLKKDFEQAADYFEAASRADTRRAEPLINLGAVQNRLKKYPLAVKTLQKALSRDRRNADAYFNLAIACRGNNQVSMATNAYREAIRLRSDFAEAHQNLGLTYLEVGNTRQAVASLKRALELAPHLKRAQRGLEEAHAAENKTKADRFGSLVATAEDATSLTTTGATLSEAARSDDRRTLLELSGRLERSIVAMLQEVREQTEPACHQACRNMTESTSAGDHRDCAARLRATLDKSKWLLSLVDEHIAALQDHESKIDQQMRAS